MDKINDWNTKEIKTDKNRLENATNWKNNGKNMREYMGTTEKKFFQSI